MPGDTGELGLFSADQVLGFLAHSGSPSTVLLVPTSTSSSFRPTAPHDAAGSSRDHLLSVPPTKPEQ